MELMSSIPINTPLFSVRSCTTEFPECVKLPEHQCYVMITRPFSPTHAQKENSSLAMQD